MILSIKVKTTSTDETASTLFDIQLNYAGLFTINNITDEKQKESILMIHCLTLLSPYARRVLSDVTRDGGFQPLATLHQQRKAQKENLQARMTFLTRETF